MKLGLSEALGLVSLGVLGFLPTTPWFKGAGPPTSDPLNGSSMCIS